MGRKGRTERRSSPCSPVNVEASFVRSAASARDLPADGLAEIAMVGRSNVGKSSLINALVRQRLARTSGAPGKTRLANIYRVARGSASPLYLVDLPGYGYARGDSGDFASLLNEYFESACGDASGRRGEARSGREAERLRSPAALLLVDSRHPGLQSDIEAWTWLRTTVEDVAIVATKIDKLARGERIRAMRELESVFDVPVLPVSVATGEGLDELWKLIEQLANNNSRRSSSPPPRRSRPAAAARTAPPRRRR
jgi:GTP-binding protein